MREKDECGWSLQKTRGLPSIGGQDETRSVPTNLNPFRHSLYFRKSQPLAQCDNGSVGSPSQLSPLVTGFLFPPPHLARRARNIRGSAYLQSFPLTNSPFLSFFASISCHPVHLCRLFQNANPQTLPPRTVSHYPLLDILFGGTLRLLNAF